MTRLPKKLLHLAGALPLLTALSCVSQVTNNSTPANGYQSIVTRNIFALNPITTPGPSNQEVIVSPPKIMLTGITTIFSQPEALFTVTGAPGTDASTQNKSYILAKGAAQDDVKVLAINAKDDTVTFNNHGIIQAIPLANGTARDEGASERTGIVSGTPFRAKVPYFARLSPEFQRRMERRFNSTNQPSATFPPAQ